MKEQFQGFPQPEPKVLQGEILLPKKRFSEAEFRYIFLMINHYHHHPEAKPQMVFIYPPPKHRPEDPVERFFMYAGEVATAVTEYAVAKGVAAYHRSRAARSGCASQTRQWAI
jgi:hypothetical protein